MQALNAAKRNVEKYYAVVGLQSQIKKTFWIMEHILPRFFKGAQDAYAKFERKKSLWKKNEGKLPRIPLKLAALEMLKRNLTMEIDFYNFIVQRFALQERGILGNQQN